MKLTRLLLLFLLIASFHAASQSFSISGQVLDSLSLEPLPYSTLISLNSGNGVVSDQTGKFFIKDMEAGDSLKFSFLGYDSYSHYVAGNASHLRVVLTPSVFMGPEVIIRPLGPELYLKQVIKKFPQNYFENTVSTLSFYSQEMKEDGRILDHIDAAFYSVINAKDLKANRHQLVLFHEAEEEELQFMRKTAEKKKAKYLKKNPEEAENFEDGELIKTSMPGPDALLGQHVGNGKLTFLDSTQFKEYDYLYGKETTYMGGEVITIEYATKGKNDGVRGSGSIYIDKSSDAIVSIQERGNFIIPLAARPILFAMGIKLENPPYKFTLKYRPMGEKWFLEQIHWDVNAKIKKRHLFSENEDALFFLSQTLLIREIHESDYNSIPDEKLFDAEKKLRDQVNPISGIGWSRVR